MPGPLAGVRVLELARILAGPWAGQVLADLGADVIKVERSKTGDDTRAWGPPFIEGKDGNHLGAAYFHGANRGKRSIELNFESPEDQRIVKKLAARSDILIENYAGRLSYFNAYGPTENTITSTLGCVKNHAESRGPASCEGTVMFRMRWLLRTAWRGVN